MSLYRGQKSRKSNVNLGARTADLHRQGCTSFVTSRHSPLLYTIPLLFPNHFVPKNENIQGHILDRLSCFLAIRLRGDGKKVAFDRCCPKTGSVPVKSASPFPDVAPVKHIFAEGLPAPMIAAGCRSHKKSGNSDRSPRKGSQRPNGKCRFSSQPLDSGA